MKILVFLSSFILLSGCQYHKIEIDCMGGEVKHTIFGINRVAGEVDFKEACGLKKNMKLDEAGKGGRE